MKAKEKRADYLAPPDAENVGWVRPQAVTHQHESRILPEGWEWSTLGDVSEKPQYGWTTKANRDTGRLKLLRTTDITSGTVDWSSVPFCTEEPEDVEKYLVESGDILISRAGSVGVSFLINKPERAVFASYLIRFRPKNGIDTKYFYYYLKSPAYWEAIGASKSGIAVPNVNASRLAQVPIPIAPLVQQKRIVAEIEKQFSRLDEAVANLKRVKANLKRYKAAVLKAAVEGSLVETEAELARREGRSYEIGAQLLQRILETRRSQWKGKGKYKEPTAPDTIDLPKLPEGWVWATFEQLSSELMNGYGKRSQVEGQPRIVLRLADISDGEISYADVRRINCTDEETGKYALAQNDLLILRVNGSPELVGRFVLVRSTNEDTLFCDHFIRVRCAMTDLSSWLKLYADSERFRRYIDLNKVSSAGQNTISQGTLLPHAVPLPPAREQQNIVTEIDRCFSLADEAEAQVNANLQRAERLRQTILQESFRGGGKPNG